MPLKYLVPNGFTALSLVVGLASIAQSATGHFETAAWLILWCVLLDKLDGGAARMLNASSEFGAEMDSFADFVGFGMAPAALVYFMRTGGSVGLGDGVVVGACAVYVLAVAIRLARYNVSEPEGSDWLFFGMPTTCAGALIGTGFLAATSHGFAGGLVGAWPAILVVFGASMVSNIRIPKFSLRWSKPVNAFQVVNVVLIYAFVPLQIFPAYLFFLGAGYLLVGVTWVLMHPEEWAHHEETGIS